MTDGDPDEVETRDLDIQGAHTRLLLIAIMLICLMALMIPAMAALATEAAAEFGDLLMECLREDVDGWGCGGPELIEDVLGQEWMGGIHDAG